MMDGWMVDGLLYCMCNMGPRKIFGPRAPQSLNPALVPYMMGHCFLKYKLSRDITYDRQQLL